jgi:hypothetical protein
MSLWSSSSITNVNVGTAPNDGSGDDIRDAFINTNTNFGNISQWLAATYVQFQNANVNGTVAGVWGNVVNANITTLYGGNVSATGGNINLSANIIPTGIGEASYDLGSVDRPFRTLYVQTTQSTTQVQASSDAGLLLVHANTTSGDVKDVGILGNVSNHFASNMYAFFGYQSASNNFVYKLTPNNAATIGNSVVYDGVYGNVRAGALFLSNVITSIGANTNVGTLVVNGDTAVRGNVNLTGNINATGVIYARGGYEVITTNIIGNYGNPYTGGVIAGNTVFLSAAISTNANTGAVSIPYGGLGVQGNVHSATGFVSPKFYGVIQTADQPNITSLGTLPTLNAVIGGFTSLGTTGLTTTGIVNLSGPTLTIASNTSIASFANIASGLIVGANAWIGGTITGLGNVFLNSNLTVGSNVTVGSAITTGNSFTVGTATTITNNLTGISSSGTVNLDMFSATVFGSAKYLVQIVDTGVTPNRVETAELTLVHDRNGSSTLVYINTYGVVTNDGSLGVFTGAYSSGTIRLQFTPNYTPTAMAIKVVRTAVTL